MFNWRPKTKGRGSSSSTSDSGDSPTTMISTSSDGCRSGQPSIVQSVELSDRERPVQQMPLLDYQPLESRTLPPSSKRMPGSVSQSTQDEYYTRNELATFKFGSPRTTSVTETSSQIDPLSSEEDFPPHEADTTPRPSLVVHTGALLSNPLRAFNLSDQYPSVDTRPIQSDAPINTTTLRSLKSTSTPSLANPSDRDSSQSRAEMSSEQSSDDEPRAIYYTFPYVESISSSSTDSNSTRNLYDDEDFSDTDLEISSALIDEVDSFDQSYWDMPPDQDFIANYLTQRRGSNPIAIPGAQERFPQGRDRENSVATVMFPTPSAPSSSNLSPRSPTPPALNALSLPNNEADWGQRRRAIRNRLEPSAARVHPSIQVIDFATSPDHASVSRGTPTTHLNDTALEFDMNEWKDISSGIKGGGELRDVGAAPREPVNPNFWSRFTPYDVLRRPSIASTINDTFQKHALAYKDQDWSFKKEKGDGTAHSKKRNTFIPFHERPLKKGKPWKGMTIGQIEYWHNDLTGIYKVERMGIPGGENRPPQQRLSVQHVRGASTYAQGFFPRLVYDNGPTTTIHKHSRAAAFSLSRYYRPQCRSAEGRKSALKAQPHQNATYANQKKTAMILLASRKVQEAYTSTTTTQKLKLHGLLGETHRSRELERLERLAEQDDRLKEKAQMKEKARHEKEQRKEERARKDKGNVKVRRELTSHSGASELSQIENDFTSLGILVPHHSLPSTSPPNELIQTEAEINFFPPEKLHTELPGALAQHTPFKGDCSMQSQVPHNLPAQMQHPTDSTPEPRVINANQAYPSSGEHLYGHDEDEDMDEEDEKLGLVPRRRRRTPHSEAYHTLPPESIDSFATPQDIHFRGFLPWLSGRNASHRTLRIDTPYQPPWLSAPSRPSNFDVQMQVVAGLNTSFQDVGLLPSGREIRENRKRKALKSQVRHSRTERKYIKEKDIFTDIPDDALYMLLPLWPSETDPVSSKDHPFKVPPIAIADRLYLLVYYKPWYPSETSGKSKDKSRISRGSPTSSQDGIYIDERNILMSQFYVGARTIAYDDLEGSNVRVPENGLSVMGPLREAWTCIPVNDRSSKTNSKGKEKDAGKGKGEDAGKGKDFFDCIIGSYQSRDHPVEFYPEGFARMKLATQEEEVSSHSDNSVPSGSTAVTPGSGRIKELSSSNPSTSSLASVSSGSGGSQLDMNNIAPFGEPTSVKHINLNHLIVTSEEIPIQEPPIRLTPIGRAVLEMAFMGALAVTGFSPGSI